MADSFVFYKSFYEAMKFLDPETKCKAYDAICDYAFNGELPSGGGMERAVFELVKPQIDANEKRRAIGRANGEKGAEYGKLGGRPKKPLDNPQKTPKKPQKNPRETDNKPANVNVNDNVNANDNENVNVNVNANKDQRYFPNDELLEKTFKDFREMRKKTKHPMTDRAIELMLSKLEKMTADPIEKVKILEQSILHGWTDIYEVKEEQGRKQTKIESIADRWADVH